MAPCLTTSNLIQLRARATLPTRQYAETIKKSERKIQGEKERGLLLDFHSQTHVLVPDIRTLSLKGYFTQKYTFC